MKARHVIPALLIAAVVICIGIADSTSSEQDDVARIGDTHYPSIESAVAAAHQGDTIVVISDCSFEKDTVIPQGVTLLLPYDDPLNNTDMDGTMDGESQEKTTRKIVDASHLRIRVTVPAGITVRVDGDLIVGGVLSRPFHFDYQGHTSWDYSQIDVNGTLRVGGSLHCYGFIKGNGEVIAMNGSSVYEPLIVTDYVGGDNAFNMFYGGQAPFNRYAFINIQADFEIEYGSKLYGLGNLYADDKYNKATVCIIGQFASDDAIVLLKEGAAANLSYNPDKYAMNKNDPKEAWESNIYKDIGKTTVHLRGNVSFGKIQMEVMGYKIDTSKVFFSIPYNMDIFADDGTYSVDYMLRILPGSVVTVGEDASLNVNNTLIVFDGLEDRTFRDKHYPWTSTLSECGFDVCGRLIVNGSLRVNPGATFAGIVETTSGTGAITVDDSCKSVRNVSVDYGVDLQAPPIAKPTDNVTTRVLSAMVYDGNTLSAISVGKCTATDSAAFRHTQYSYSIKGEQHTVQVNQELRGAWKTGSPTFVMEVSELPDAAQVGRMFEEHANTDIELIIQVVDLNKGKGLATDVFKAIPKNLALSVLVVNTNTADDVEKLYKYTFTYDASYVPDKEYLRLQIITKTSSEMDAAIKEMDLVKYMTLDMLGGCSMPANTQVTFYLKSVFDSGEQMRIFAFGTDGKLIQFGTGMGIDATTITYHTDRATEMLFCIVKDPVYPSLQDTFEIAIIAAIIAAIIVLAVAAYLYRRKRRKNRMEQIQES